MDKRIFKILQDGWDYEYKGTKMYDKYGPLKTEEEAIDYLLGLGGYEQDRSSRRWWDDVTVVAEVQVDDDQSYFVGYAGADTTGDLTAEERGWEFDPKTIKLYNRQEKVVTYFEPAG